MVKNHMIGLRCNKRTKKLWERFKDRDGFESPAEALREAVKFYEQKHPDAIIASGEE